MAKGAKQHDARAGFLFRGLTAARAGFGAGFFFGAGFGFGFGFFFMTMAAGFAGRFTDFFLTTRTARATGFFFGAFGLGFGFGFGFFTAAAAGFTVFFLRLRGAGFL
jgi:hypothetical protein